jgi:lysyl endopeptidase
VLHSFPLVFSRLRFLAPVLALAWAAPVAAQEPQVPFGLTHADKLLPTSQIDLYQTPAIDAPSLLAADDGKRLPGDEPRPLQYAVPFPVEIDPGKAGTWETVNVGGRDHAVWRLLVRAPGALHVNLGFTRFWVPEGAQLSVYAADYRQGDKPERLRQFTARDIDAHGELWIPLVPRTDAVVVELVVPPAQRPLVKLVLGSINSGFRPIRDILGVSGSCNVDVVCPQGDPYRNEIRAVGVLSRNGSSLCTGSLINNTGAKRPLFITADHCGLRASNAATVVVFWNFQNSTCRAVNSGASGSDGDGNLNQFNSGSIFLATFSTSDFTLVELDDAPQQAFNVFLAGWDRRVGPFSDGAVGIHHPAVAEKRISLSNRATEDDGGTHHRVWWRPGIGVTEPGSSGSPVYTKQGRFIGQLTGGASACGNADADMWDVYGKLSRSWDGGGSASNRVRDHIDPAGTAPVMIDGRNWNDGGDTTPPTTSITAPANGATVSGTVSVTANASDNVGVARVEFLVDGAVAATDTSAPYSFSWNTAGVANGSHTLRSRAFDAASNSGQSALVTVNVSNAASTTVFSDGFGTNLGWVTNPNATDTATTGRWQRGNPEGTTSGGTALQLDPCAGGTPNCLVTGLTAGGSAGANDVDGGVTTIQSPAIALPSGTGLTLTFNFYFAHLGNSSSADFFRVRVVGPGGTTTVFQELGTASVDAAAWAPATVSLSAFAGQTVRIRIEAADAAEGSLVEAAVDDVKITRP